MTLPSFHDLKHPDVVLGNFSVLEFNDNNLAVLPRDLEWLAVFKDLEAVVFVNDGQVGSHVMSPFRETSLPTTQDDVGPSGM
jgi:hypothetical protein